MGREASCQCTWAGQTAACKVLLESTELVVRGAIRRRILISALTNVSVKDNELTFRAGEDEVALTLGPELAQRWAKAIASPPPSLAKKLGISRASKVLVIGALVGSDLKGALAEAGAVDRVDPNMILACVNTQAELERALGECSGHRVCPLWIVYPKGAGQKLSEAGVREALRNQGFMDVKVVSVSAKLTALRFVKCATYATVL